MADEGRAGLTDSIEVNADPETVMGVILEYEKYPEWMTNIKEIEVLERDGEQRGTKVKLKAKTVFTEINLVVRTSYDPGGNRLDSEVIEGDVRDCRASYNLEPLDNHRTRVTYHYEVTYSLPKALRGPLSIRLTKQVNKLMVKSALQDLKKRVESL